MNARTPTPPIDADVAVSTELEEFAAIGDGRTLGLVGRIGHGAELAWWCHPRFDDGSVFASLLDPDGGSWRIDVVDATRSTIAAVDGANVVRTGIGGPDGFVEVFDALPFPGDEPGPGAIRRVVRCRSGRVRLRSTLVARPDHGRVEPSFRTDDGVVTIAWTDTDGREQALAHRASIRRAGQARALDPALDDGALVLEAELHEGDEVSLVLGEHDRATAATAARASDELAAIVGRWRQWLAGSSYHGRWPAPVRRSALVLKLLAHVDGGGLIAAGTTSLPEHPGGERNWDYRYVWIRDAAFTVYAFLELDLVDEAEDFVGWLLERVLVCEVDDDADGSPLPPLYDLDGRSDLDETTLDHWAGHLDSRPVRIGNGAAGQHQLDAFGALLDALYLFDKHRSGLSLDAWDRVVDLVDWLCANWAEPDDGMWEVRSGAVRFSSSLLLAWTALERAIRMAEFRGRPAPIEAWRAARDEIHTTLRTEAWNPDLEAFTQTLGGDQTDASMLLAPLVKFISGDDPQWLSTMRAIDDQLGSGAHVRRYDPEAVDDGVGGDEGAMTICSFWMVEALARAGRTDEARDRFEQLLACAGRGGLLSEQIGHDGRQLGNLPQAFSHLALISAAVHLDQALDRGTGASG